jgi:non-ribosomal peptide synthetase component E (peptide arylation enzyme)
LILGNPSQATAASALRGPDTLDDLFRRAALRRPGAIALADSPNRETFTDGTPRQLTYAEADRMISAIAERLLQLGLRTDAIVGIQLPNMVESVLTLLGVLRAGMIAAPLPLLWRQSEITNALRRLGAKALITCGHVGSVDHAAVVMEAAAELFSIRYVCAFGGNLPDGVVPLDGLYMAKPEPLPRIERDNPAAHIAVITWDVSRDGFVPIARNHMEIIAGGLAIFLEGGFERDAIFLSSLAPSSFAGLALTLLPWLLTGGTLALHQPFDADGFAVQLRDHRCDAAVLPGPVVSLFADAGYLAASSGLKTVMALWRSPECLNTGAWYSNNIALVDVLAFGETGVIATRRGADGKSAPLSLGAINAPRGAPGGVLVGELRRTEMGTVAMGGSMVPRHPFFPEASETADGVGDTGYTCRTDPDTKTLTVTGPPAGMVAVGGYLFAVSNLDELAAKVAGAEHIIALPDLLCGHRLCGAAKNAAAVQAELAGRGINPLIVAAFGAR